MVVHGHDTTLPITLDEMLVHYRAVARGSKRSLLGGDLPFGTYESCSNQKSEGNQQHGFGEMNSHRYSSQGADAIKLEGGAPSRITAAKAIVEAGIAVMGHVGLTPQAISVLGGFRPQGRTLLVVETALALQQAGCFSVVLECVPAPVAAATTSALQIPTTGVGAGPFCGGQALVYHDLLGMLQHLHHAKVSPTTVIPVTPKFCKTVWAGWRYYQQSSFGVQGRSGQWIFPGPAHSPYKISAADVVGFLNELQKLGLEKAASAVATAIEKIETTDGGSPRRG
ncbi:unnamed protein product [Ilex paraguariensis]|uniref:3-methyl-2-oxobutanoate hydroxymethyltransferase n=1 Tax=Ilex paraguariensis TaxID=185542 RepID=A0ABC8S4M9_9AQUA